MVLLVRRYASGLARLQNAGVTSTVCRHMSPEHGSKGACLCSVDVRHVTLLKMLGLLEAGNVRTTRSPQMKEHKVGASRQQP